jgi:hypothetical protein
MSVGEVEEDPQLFQTVESGLGSLFLFGGGLFRRERFDRFVGSSLRILWCAYVWSMLNFQMLPEKRRHGSLICSATCGTKG